MRRYIDADKYKDGLLKRRDAAVHWHDSTEEEDVRTRAVQAILTVNECILSVNEQPTADVRENVRGEWHDGDCSCCGWSWRDIAYDSDLHNGLQSNFCPNCGADMRGGTQ